MTIPNSFRNEVTWAVAKEWSLLPGLPEGFLLRKPQEYWREFEGFRNGGGVE